MRLWTFCSASSIALSLVSHSWAEPKPSRVYLDASLGTRWGGSHAIDLADPDATIVGSGRISVDSSLAWGVIAAYQIQSNGSVYFSYSRQETTFRLRTTAVTSDGWAVDDATGKGSIEYFQFGGNLQAPTRLIVPYLGVSLGLTRFASTEASQGDWARFNVTLDGGFRFDLVPLIDLRAFARVPFTFAKTEIYCFSGHGCALTSNGSPFVQGELHFGAGLKF